MALKKYKAITNGLRHMTSLDYAEITTDKPEKSLLKTIKRSSGRNNQGKITVRHQGGGAKRKYRIIDFKRNKDNIPGRVATIEYDPNRTSNIALINYADGEKRYIIAPKGLEVGMTIESGENGVVPSDGLREMERIQKWQIPLRLELRYQALVRNAKVLQMT